MDKHLMIYSLFIRNCQDDFEDLLRFFHQKNNIIFVLSALKNRHPFSKNYADMGKYCDYANPRV